MVPLVKKLPANAGDPRVNSWVGKIPWRGNGNPVQYSCLENPMDRGALQPTVHVVTRVGHNLPTKPPPTLKMCYLGILNILSGRSL